jgi:quinol-cytochrome oxidoreductase complex cytochrome b subunit
VNGFAFYLGVGFTLMGLVYTAVVLFVRGATYGTERRPYILNGIALVILGVSLFARAFSAGNWIVYLLWAVAAYLAIRANREIVASRDR